MVIPGAISQRLQVLLRDPQLDACQSLCLIDVAISRERHHRTATLYPQRLDLQRRHDAGDPAPDGRACLEPLVSEVGQGIHEYVPAQALSARDDADEHHVVPRGVERLVLHDWSLTVVA